MVRVGAITDSTRMGIHKGLSQRFSNVFISGSFNTPKNYAGPPKNFCFYGLQLLIFSLLEIKTEILKIKNTPAYIPVSHQNNYGITESLENTTLSERIRVKKLNAALILFLISLTP